MKDRTREALFSILEPIEASTGVLDLFGGSGALVFEAISRGAARGIVVERHGPTARRIESHAANFGIADRIDVVASDVFRWWRGEPLPAMREWSPWLVFCCPPYDLAAARPVELSELLVSLREFAPRGSRLVLETDDRFDGEQHLGPSWRARTYSPAVLWFSAT